MACVLVTYDLVKKKDYPELISALEKYKYWHCLGSVWILKTEKSALAVTKQLVAHIDSDDKLIAVELKVDGAAWTTSFSADCKAWLKENI